MQPMREEVAGVLTQEAISPSPIIEDAAVSLLQSAHCDGALSQAQLPPDQIASHTAGEDRGIDAPGRVTTADVAVMKAEIQELRSQLEQLQSSCRAQTDLFDRTNTNESHRIDPGMLSIDINHAPTLDNELNIQEDQAGAVTGAHGEGSGLPFPLPTLEVGSCKGEAACRLFPLLI